MAHAPPSLETVKRKLRRAEEDLQSLRSQLAAFDDSDMGHVTIDVDPEDGAQVLRFHVLRQPDPEWEITVGVVAYQIRSALDQLVTNLVSLDGGDPDEHRGAFPIFLRRDDYWKPERPGRLSRRDRLLRGVPEDQRALIDALQPYERGTPSAIKHDPLAVLDAVCNGDKHRYGHPAAVVLRSTSYAVVDDAAREVAVFHRDFGPPDDERPARGKPIEDGAVIDRIGGRSDTAHLPKGPVEVAAIRVGVRFGRPRIFVPDLERILEYVRSQVVARFDPFFDDRQHR